LDTSVRGPSRRYSSNVRCVSQHATKAFHDLDPTCTAGVAGAYRSREKQPSRNHLLQMSADCSKFHTAYRQMRESKPTGGFSEDNTISMAFSIHTARLRTWTTRIGIHRTKTGSLRRLEGSQRSPEVAGHRVWDDRRRLYGQ
jgi:hypothetical protein